MIRKIFVDILTECDNQTYDHVKVVGFISFLFYYALAVISLLNGHAWPAMDFASGLGTMSVAFGVHSKLKSNENINATK